MVSASLSLHGSLRVSLYHCLSWLCAGARTARLFQGKKGGRQIRFRNKQGWGVRVESRVCPLVGGFAAVAWAEEASVPREQVKPPWRKCIAQMGALEPCLVLWPHLQALLSVLQEGWVLLGSVTGMAQRGPPQGIVGSTFEDIIGHRESKMWVEVLLGK